MRFTIMLFVCAFSIALWAEEDYISNTELQKIKLPTIHEETAAEDAILDDIKVLRERLKRKDIIEEKAMGLPFMILPHRPNYIMPLAYTETPYEDPYAEVLEDEWPGFSNYEAIFQISVKYQVFKFDKANKNRLYVAYTNKSYWQVYNSDLSRPFRETNHEPELILQLSPNWGYINRINLAFNHQSNGQYQGFSRSWNRITGGIYHMDGNSVYGIEPWYRIPETSSSDPNDPKDDDNPDIHSYLGYANFIWYKQLGRQSASIIFGNNLQEKNNRGRFEVEWNFPVSSRVRGFIQYFEGYGHSLIEYNQYQRRIGIGFKISDYL